MICSDETKIDRFHCDSCDWCLVRDGEFQLQAHHMSRIIKHGGGTILCGVVWLPVA